MISILVVDDQPILASGLIGLLRSVDEFKVLGMANDGATAIEEILHWKPDVVVQDVNLPDISGAEVMARVREHNDRIRFLFFSVLPENAVALKLIQEGANGFVNKTSRMSVMREAIKSVHRGERYMSPSLEALYLEQETQRSKSGLALLSQREREVFLLLAKGVRQKEILERFHLTSGALGSYVARIHRKLGTNSLAQLIKYGISEGVIE